MSEGGERPMKAVLFDFNGTLYNDTALHMAAWKNFFRKFFDMKLTDEEVFRRCIGPSNADIFADFFHGTLSEAEVARLSGEKEKEYLAAARSDPKNLQLMDGAPEMFDRLTESGVPFALATASPIGNVEFYLEDLGLKRWFTLDRIVYDEGTLPCKPDPAFYIEAARRLGLTPRECVIVEDSRTGIQAAVNAGAGRIVAMDRTTPRDWLEGNPHIDAIVHDYFHFEDAMGEFDS